MVICHIKWTHLSKHDTKLYDISHSVGKQTMLQWVSREDIGNNGKLLESCVDCLVSSTADLHVPALRVPIGVFWLDCEDRLIPSISDISLTNSLIEYVVGGFEKEDRSRIRGACRGRQVARKGKDGYAVDAFQIAL